MFQLMLYLHHKTLFCVQVNAVVHIPALGCWAATDVNALRFTLQKTESGLKDYTFHNNLINSAENHTSKSIYNAELEFLI